MEAARRCQWFERLRRSLGSVRDRSLAVCTREHTVWVSAKLAAVVGSNRWHNAAWTPKVNFAKEQKRATNQVHKLEVLEATLSRLAQVALAF